MLAVVEQLSEIGVTSGTVYVESDASAGAIAVDELTSKKAKDLAVLYSQQRGLPNPRITTVVLRPFAINNQGVLLARVDKKAPPSERVMSRMRVKIEVTSR